MEGHGGSLQTGYVRCWDATCTRDHNVFEGKAKAIGVSNYTTRHLEELMSYATIVPHLVQAS